MSKYLFILALLFIAGSCKKSSTSHQILVTSTDFPATVGSWWFYKDGNETDTIKIVDVITLQNITVQRWVQINSINLFNDTMYVASDSSIRFYHMPNLSQTFLSINLPVIENTPWGPSTQATDFSSQVQNVTVNNVTYADAVYLHQSSPIVFGVSLNESIWIKKGIGIVKHDITGAGSSTHHYELLSYHLN